MRIFILLLLFPFVASASCFDDLQSMGWRVKAVQSPSGFCSINEAVRLYATDTTTFHPSVLLSCSTAKDVGMWAKYISAKRIDNVGGYVCRKQRSSIFPSQHSFGKAIDVTAIDGVPISKDWHSAYKAGCKFFNTVLTPMHDSLHHDHLHMDNGYGYSCLFDIVR
tara:strand:- start:1121 stop:1615 length:495 start_codon:yes stop_codon:yes gene_type:complete